MTSCLHWGRCISTLMHLSGGYAETPNMLSAIAQFETEIRAERQIDGIQKAKERGVKFGRKKKLTTHQTAEMRQRRKQGALIKTLMKDYDLSKASVYRHLSENYANQSGENA